MLALVLSGWRKTGSSWLQQCPQQCPQKYPLRARYCRMRMYVPVTVGLTNSAGIRSSRQCAGRGCRPAAQGAARGMRRIAMPTGRVVAAARAAVHRCRHCHIYGVHSRPHLQTSRPPTQQLAAPPDLRAGDRAGVSSCTIERAGEYLQEAALIMQWTDAGKAARVFVRAGQKVARVTLGREAEVRRRCVLQVEGAARVGSHVRRPTKIAPVPAHAHWPRLARHPEHP